MTKPANDNCPPLIGLTGLRNVGKTTVADLLVEEFGFVKVHAFDSGKEAAVRYFEMCGAPTRVAKEMVYGELKDKPSLLLPNARPPRYFLEKFGKFMGVDLGMDWTLAVELKQAANIHPGKPIVVESVVYEADWFRDQGGFIVRLERPGHEGPKGVESDAEQAKILADYRIRADNLDDLREAARAMVPTALRILDGKNKRAAFEPLWNMP